jgi:transcriptional regulator
MQQGYKTKQSLKAAETIYRLRQQGWAHQKIADEIGKTLAIVTQTAKKETTYQYKAFEDPFLEYIASRTAKGIEKALEEKILAEMEKLREADLIKILLYWTGVEDGILRDLAK